MNEEQDRRQSDLQQSEFQPLNAECVYLLMKGEYRISRNTRASWYFQNVGKTISYTPSEQTMSSTNELTVLSMEPESGETDSSQLQLGNEYKFLLTPSTIVTFIARRYRLVFVLDLSPSAACVDTYSGTIVYDEIYKTLQKSMQGLVQPFIIPGSFSVMAPGIYVTVIAYTPLLSCGCNQVLAQGVLVKSDTIDDFLADIKTRLETIETQLASSFSHIINRHSSRESSCERLTGGLFDDLIDKNDRPVRAQSQLVGAEPSFVHMLRYGILALQLLPQNSSAGIVVITDGLVGLPDASVFESLLLQLRNGTISCSFLLAGRRHHSNNALGHVPHTELMQFLATATFGAYFAACPTINTTSTPALNDYHRAFFFWNFQKGLEGFKIDDLPDDGQSELTEDLAWTYGPSQKRSSLSPIVRKKHVEETLHTNIFSVLALRLREGYTVRDILITKGGTELSVSLVQPWRDYVTIEYTVSSTWPLDSTRLLTHIQVSLEGSYEFLHDITCTSNKRPFSSHFRTNVVKKFWQTLQSLSQTDKLLVHLQSFASNPAYYNVPESVRSGLPLFALTANSTVPSVNQQLSSKDKAMVQFSSFWKPVVMLDINIWQKWMHTHRIGVVLEQDMPLPKYLHVSNASGRFNIVQCRHALSRLNSLLREWSTFVLLENHSYINLVFSEPNKRPTSFYLLRVTSKAPCMVLRLAFLGGMTGSERNKITSELREAVLSLKFPQRGPQRDKRQQHRLQKDAVAAAIAAGKALMAGKKHKPPLMRDWSDTHCCILLTKPVEKFLIRYDRVPRDLTVLEESQSMSRSISDAHRSSTRDGGTSLISGGMYWTLSRYLHHRRWIWSIQSHASMPFISNLALGRILSTLTKIRLQEGFHFAASGSGVANMILEADMQVNQRQESSSTVVGDSHEDLNKCVVQYILFPPHIKPSKNSVSDDETDEGEAPESDAELELVTEVWVEPQCGHFINSAMERQHWDNLTYTNLPNAFYPVDYDCICSLLTFESLIGASLNNTVARGQAEFAPRHTSGFGNDVSGDDRPCPDSSETSIHRVPFVFDLLSLLPRCQQAELLFSAYLTDPHQVVTENVDAGSFPNAILIDLLHQTLDDQHDYCWTLSTTESQSFMSHVSQRSRDSITHPLPFALHHFQFTNNQLASGSRLAPTSESDITISASVVKTASCDTLVSHITETSRDTDRDTMIITSTEPDHSIHASLSPASHSVAPGSASTNTSPVWKCYVKAFTAIQVYIVLVPATYDDFLQLGQCGSDLSVPSPKQQMTNPPVTLKPPPLKIVDSTPPVLSTPVVTSQKSPTQAPSISILKQSDSEQVKTAEVDGLVSVKLDVKADDGVASADSTQVEAACKEPELGQKDQAITDWLDQTQLANSERLYIPVYVYECSLPNITESLTNRWNFTLPKDVFKSLGLSADVDLMTGTSAPVTPRDRSVPLFEPDKEYINMKAQEEEGRDKLRGSLDRRSNENMMENIADLQTQCSLLADIYFSSYVKGVFQCLQSSSSSIAPLDADYAINVLCTESPPIELDITSFLLLSCGHMTGYVTQAHQENGMIFGGSERVESKESSPGNAVVQFADTVPITIQENLESPYPPSVFHTPSPNDCTENGTGVITEDVLSTGAMPDSAVKVTISDLRASITPCEVSKGLHELIQNKFTSIVSQSFRPVPSLPEFYFYCPELDLHPADETDVVDSYPEDTQVESANQDGSGSTVIPANPPVLDTVGKSVEDKMHITTDGFSPQDVQDLMEDDYDEYDRLSTISIPDDESLSGAFEIDIEELDESHDSELARTEPLFIHFMCTLKTTQNHNSISTRLLPTCLGEVVRSIEAELNDFALGDLKLTLDIYCLTLSQECEIPSSVIQKPEIIQMISTESTTSESGGETSGITGADQPSFVLQSSNDALSSLPRLQKDTVMRCHDELSWLLKDEVTSSLRLLQPVTAQMLRAVANHISASVAMEKPANITKVVPLQFVYGSEKSHEHFKQELERLPLPRYRLRKEGPYYYLILDQAHVHAMMLNSALVKLSRECSPVKEGKRVSMDSDSIGNTGRCEDGKERHRSGDSKIHMSGGKDDLARLRHLSGHSDGGTAASKSCEKRGAFDLNRLTKSDESTPHRTRWQSGEKGKSPVARLYIKEVGSLPAGSSATSKALTAGTEVVRLRNESMPQSGLLSSQTTTEAHTSITAESLTCEAESLATATQSDSSVVMKRSSSFSGFQGADATWLSSIGIHKLNESAFRGYSQVVECNLKAVASVPQISQGHVRTQHFSGPDTPLSYLSTRPHTPSWLSSTSSYEGEGYEAGRSESETDDLDSISDTEPSVTRLPNFWIILEVMNDCINLYYHTRHIPGETALEETEELVHQKSLLQHVTEHLSQRCRFVNQHLLLLDLNETRMCHALLVPEADEDVSWRRDSQRTDKTDYDDDEDDDYEHEDKSPAQNYLAATMQFTPGYFACECTWRIRFPLHPRLKTGTAKAGISRGVSCLRAVLHAFSVSNRKNMFVYKESSSGAVFYLRLDQSCQSITHQDSSHSQKQDMALGSRSSSMISLTSKKTEPDTEEMGVIGSSCADKDADTTSLTGTSQLKLNTEDCLQVSVHGIVSAGAEITSELMQVLQNRLDEGVLDVISNALQRNPNCKLNIDDVQFIQCLNDKPVEAWLLTVPSVASLHLCALMYYLRQNMLQFLHTPNYIASDTGSHFQERVDESWRPVSDNNAFLFNRPQSSGGKGIALITLALVDGCNNQKKVIECLPPSLSAHMEMIQAEEFPDLVKTTMYNDHVRKSPGLVNPIGTNLEYIPMMLGSSVITLSSHDQGHCDKQETGPTSLIRFHVWQRGNIQLPALRDKLVQALTHALCDLTMEYTLLTAPICSLPEDYSTLETIKHYGLTAISAPNSPNPVASVESRESARFSFLKDASDVLSSSKSPSKSSQPSAIQSLWKDMSDALTKRSAAPSAKVVRAFDFGSPSQTAITNDIVSGSPQQMPKSAGPYGPRLSGAEDTLKRHSIDLLNIRQSFEAGERGELRDIYKSLLPQWMDFAHAQGAPSLSKLELSLDACHSIDFVLSDVQRAITNFASDVVVKMFKLSTKQSSQDPEETVGVAYTAGASQTCSKCGYHVVQQQKSDSSCCEHCFLVIGRNITQWRTSLDDNNAFGQVRNQCSNMKALKTYQRFSPFDSSATKGSLPPEYEPPSNSDTVFIPRQRFVLLRVQQRHVCIWVYNWASDLTNLLFKHLTKLVHWHNARTHLLGCILTQKMGLYKHAPLGELATGQETNPFIQGNVDVELLAKPTPPASQAQRHPTNSMASSSQRTSAHIMCILRPFDDTYKGQQPSHPMQNTPYWLTSDPVAKHVAQAHGIRSHDRREMEKTVKLQKLYTEWHQKPTSSKTPISEEYISLLRQCSRLVHYCATPLLFSQIWRNRAMSKNESAVPPAAGGKESHRVHLGQQQQQQSSLDKTDARSRSRHGSGASSGSSSSKVKRVENSETGTKKNAEVSPPRQLAEEPWHIDLRSSFLAQYLEYLRSHGFEIIATRPSSPKRCVRPSRKPDPSSAQSKRSETLEPDSGCCSSSMVCHLQKTLPSGILLIQVSFRQVYFCVKLYALDITRSSTWRVSAAAASSASTQQLHFVDECDRYRDEIHVHSFAHDFHLRCIQAYIANPSVSFKLGYNIASFLADFERVHPYPPSFSRNYLYGGSITVENVSLPSSQLYKYMLQHAKLYGMREVTMIPAAHRSDAHMETQSALVSQHRYQSALDEIDSPGKSICDYDVGLVITLVQTSGYYGNTSDPTLLRLRYHLILTSRRELFPHKSLEKKLGALKSLSGRQIPAGRVFLTLSSSPMLYTESATDLSSLSEADTDPGADVLSTHTGSEHDDLPDEQRVTVECDAINYLGFSAAHHSPILKLLHKEVESVKQHIHSIVSQSMAQCRRDMLWNRLLVAVDELFSKKKRLSIISLDTQRDLLSQRLSFTEFLELLSMVRRVTLSELDPQLMIFMTLGTVWYRSLVSLLMAKYPDTYRLFESSDGLLQYVVIVNPKCLDMAVMLAVDMHGRSQELCLLIRDGTSDEPQVQDIGSPSFHHSSPRARNVAMDSNVSGRSTYSSSRAMHEHIESVVNACCFHMWSALH